MTHLLLLALLPSPAHAEPAAAAMDVACFGPAPTDSIPATGATDVPLDVSPVVVFNEDCGTATWTLVLTRGDDGVEITRTEATVGTIAELAVPSLLDPETAYVLTLTDTSEREHVIGFTTGTAESEASASPVVTAVGGGWTESDRMVEFFAYGTPGAHEALLEFVDDDGDVVGAAIVRAGEDVSAVWSRSRPRPPEEVCVSLAQRDVAGEWTESEILCDEVDVVNEDTTPRYCSSAAGGAPAVFTAILAALAGLRRRRR